MNLHPTAEQSAFLEALDKLLAQTGQPAADGQRSFFSAAADAALEAGGLLDAAGFEEFGPLAAAMLVDRVARLPIVVEAGASSLVRPLACPDWPRPLAVIVGDTGGAARFLCQARSVLFLSGGEARIARIEAGDCVDVSGFFTYPMGRLKDPAACLARSEPLGDPETCGRLMRIDEAAEINGCLQGSHDAVTEYVKVPQQFGRPHGSFQALQHRLAGAAASIAASRLLAWKAAALADAAGAMTALGHAQDCATRIVYDLHQFMGAMGLTLEHPLYRWSYRVKLLVSDMGGPYEQLDRLSIATWGAAPRDGNQGTAL